MWGPIISFNTREKCVGEGKVELCMWFWSMNRVWDSSIYQTTHLEALLFILVIRFFLCDRSALSVSWGFIRQKVQFLQCFKPVTRLFWKLEWELWICPIKSTFFFGLHLFYCCGFTVIVAFLCVLFLLRILLLIILSLWGFTLTSYGRI